VKFPISYLIKQVVSTSTEPVLREAISGQMWRSGGRTKRSGVKATSPATNELAGLL